MKWTIDVVTPQGSGLRSHQIKFTLHLCCGDVTSCAHRVNCRKHFYLAMTSCCINQARSREKMWGVCEICPLE